MMDETLRCNKCGEEMVEWNRTDDTLFFRCEDCRVTGAKFTEGGWIRRKEEFDRSGRKEKM